MKKTTFCNIDFNALYSAQKSASTHKKLDSKTWDAKAEDMNLKIHHGIYNDFIKSKINLEGVDSFLDVGCGPGTFALLYAPLVKNIVAFDFSSNMLKKLRQNADEKGFKNITAIKANIEGSWSEIPICDVALASRCFEVDDLKSALVKLDSHAKKAVYMTFKVGQSFISDELLEVLQIKIEPRPDYIYVLNVLYQMGINAKVDFIPKDDAKYCKVPTDVDEYINSIRWSLKQLSDFEESRAREYFLKSREMGKKPAFKNNAWALIYWEK